MSISPPNGSTSPEPSDAFLRLPAVKAKTGLSRSTIYDRIDKGAFPAPVRLGGKAVGWPASDIDAWIVSTVAQGRKAAG
ncbi:MAG: AlpA family transcriptional regulator [Nevskia sp.]|nr:AlpA family transcriptional regulator [Nevskia sp.]